MGEPQIEHKEHKGPVVTRRTFVKGLAGLGLATWLNGIKLPWASAAHTETVTKPKWERTKRSIIEPPGRIPKKADNTLPYKTSKTDSRKEEIKVIEKTVSGEIIIPEGAINVRKVKDVQGVEKILYLLPNGYDFDLCVVRSGTIKIIEGVLDYDPYINPDQEMNNEKNNPGGLEFAITRINHVGGDNKQKLFYGAESEYFFSEVTDLGDPQKNFASVMKMQIANKLKRTIISKMLISGRPGYLMYFSNQVVSGYQFGWNVIPVSSLYSDLGEFSVDFRTNNKINKVGMLVEETQTDGSVMLLYLLGAPGQDVIGDYKFDTIIWENPVLIDQQPPNTFGQIKVALNDDGSSSFAYLEKNSGQAKLVVAQLGNDYWGSIDKLLIKPGVQPEKVILGLKQYKNLPVVVMAVKGEQTISVYNYEKNAWLDPVATAVGGNIIDCTMRDTDDGSVVADVVIEQAGQKTTKSFVIKPPTLHHQTFTPFVKR